jgi:hypothetical protein
MQANRTVFRSLKGSATDVYRRPWAILQLVHVHRLLYAFHVMLAMTLPSVRVPVQSNKICSRQHLSLKLRTKAFCSTGKVHRISNHCKVEPFWRTNIAVTDITVMQSYPNRRPAQALRLSLFPKQQSCSCNSAAANLARWQTSTPCDRSTACFSRSVNDSR